MKDGEPEYNTLRQDSMLQRNITAALRKLPHTPYMQSVNLDKESIASFALQNWSPYICNIIEKPTRQTQDPPSSPLSAICRPMLKSSESKSLLALAKALLSLQRAIQTRPALRRENLFVALKNSFKVVLLKTLEEKGIVIHEKEDRTEEMDTELIEIALRKRIGINVS